jgi:hypothetical protein
VIYILRQYSVWRLLILSNVEKRTIMKILKKEWFIWKFWKRGGSREKGEEETKSMPHAPVYKISKIAKIVNFSGKCYIGGFKHLVGSKVWQLDRKWPSHPSKFSIIWSNNVRINECIWLFVKMWLICKNRRKKKKYELLIILRILLNIFCTTDLIVTGSNDPG